MTIAEPALPWPGSADSVAAGRASLGAAGEWRSHEETVPALPGIAAHGDAGWRRSLSRLGRPTETALVRSAQRGSEAAVEELFTRHWSSCYRAAALVTGDRAAAEDIAQEAFLAALRALPRFDARRPLRPWLHRIVVNRAIDFSRARALRSEVSADAAADAAADDANTGPAFGDDVIAALRRLGPEQRAVIVMRYVLDLTPGEIASALDLPRGTVNSRLRRGLDSLAEVMGDPA
jgi:RNA polymerase sigma-70 factor (ECF subfamily)